jgi:hypothetical protein
VGRCRRAVLDARLEDTTQGRAGACLQPTPRRVSRRARHVLAQPVQASTHHRSPPKPACTPTPSRDASGQGVGQFFKVRKALGVNAFGLNEVRLPAGESGPEHG